MAKVVSGLDGTLAAAQALQSGQLVGLPTETVYGLAGSIHDEAAVARIFTAKGRPADHPLIVHVAGIDQLPELVKDLPDYAPVLADHLWPGPLTLILRASSGVSRAVTGGQDTVAIRIPAHETALATLRLAQVPVAAPSANRFGRVSPTSAHAVANDLGPYLGHDDVILDGGQCAVGLESTIVSCLGSSPVILRPGAIGAEDLASVGVAVGESEGSGPQVSGSLPAHYQPEVPVALSSVPGSLPVSVGLIAEVKYADKGGTRLLAAGDLSHYAAELYAALRAADELGLERVIVVPPSGDEPLAIALRDRLARVAAKA